MLLASTIRATNQMSKNIPGTYLHYSIDAQTNLLQKTSKDLLLLPVVNLDKASVCGDRKTSFSCWQKQKFGIHTYREFRSVGRVSYLGAQYQLVPTILGLITCMFPEQSHLDMYGNIREVTLCRTTDVCSSFALSIYNCIICIFAFHLYFGLKWKSAFSEKNKKKKNNTTLSKGNWPDKQNCTLPTTLNNTQPLSDPDILSTAIAYLCVTDAKHFLNDPHSDKNAIMSSVLIP